MMTPVDEKDRGMVTQVEEEEEEEKWNMVMRVE